MVRPSRGLPPEETHFHYACGFATQSLAHMLDSLVRVSRRDGWRHWVIISNRQAVGGGGTRPIEEHSELSPPSAGTGPADHTLPRRRRFLHRILVPQWAEWYPRWGYNPRRRPRGPKPRHLPQDLIPLHLLMMTRTAAGMLHPHGARKRRPVPMTTEDHSSDHPGTARAGEPTVGKFWLLPPIASLLTISSTFNSLFKVLFIFPSRYLFAIGLPPLFSFRRNLPPTLGCTPEQPDSANWQHVSAGRGPRRRYTGLSPSPVSRSRELVRRWPARGAVHETTIRGHRLPQISSLSSFHFTRSYCGNPS